MCQNFLANTVNEDYIIEIVVNMKISVLQFLNKPEYDTKNML